jgi:hypothetical protein
MVKFPFLAYIFNHLSATLAIAVTSVSSQCITPPQQQDREASAPPAIMSCKSRKIERYSTNFKVEITMCVEGYLSLIFEQFDVVNEDFSFSCKTM